MPPPPGDADDDPLDRSLLRQLAGEEGFHRGERVFAAGRVGHLRSSPGRATARVNGSSRFYRVKLWLSRGELHASCTCPLGREGGFCKHCVAVGLAWLQGAPAAGGKGEEGSPELERSETHPTHTHPSPGGAGGSPAKPPPGPGQGPGHGHSDSPVTPAELRGYVASLDKRRLMDLVLEAIDYDEILRRRLMLETTGAPGGNRLTGRELEIYRHLLVEAIRTGEYVDYESMPDYVQGVEEAIAPLSTLLESVQPAPVVELCELALVELDAAADLLDTSDGSLNGVYDELQRLHLEACRLARLDPVKLAGRLLEYELEGGLGVFNNAIAAYAEVLGPRGQAAYRALLVEAWNRLPPLRNFNAAGNATPPAPTPHPGAAPDDDGTESEPPPLDHRRFQLAALMERMAALAGADVDTLAAIKARDLSSPQDFLAIARLYEEAGRPEQALEWAEKGLGAFPRADRDVIGGLRDFLADLYGRHDRPEDALTLAWAQFLDQPTVERYNRLHGCCLTPEAWPRWREHALHHLRAAAAGAAARGTLLEILLAEDDLEGALAEARAAGSRLRSDVALVLAARLEKTHPAEAMEIYRGQLDTMLANETPPRLLRQVNDLLRTIRRLLHRLGRPGEFISLREELRTSQRHRRGLVKLLDGLGRN